MTPLQQRMIEDMTVRGLAVTTQQASLRAQITSQMDIINAQQQQLDLLNQQFELGAVARGDVLQQQAQLAQTQAELQRRDRDAANARWTQFGDGVRAKVKVAMDAVVDEALMPDRRLIAEEFRGPMKACRLFAFL